MFEWHQIISIYVFWSKLIKKNIFAVKLNRTKPNQNEVNGLKLIFIIK